MTSQARATDKQWFGHPRGLSTLFFTEMWERFSYYGMRGILLLFLVNAVATGGFGMSDRTASAIYGLYVGMVYLMALPGGWIADRILGQRRAVFLGGCIIAAGHFSMALPTVPTFYLGLCLIVIGTGLLKPNVSAMVGDLYPEGGARRDSGFSIFYSGINTGALFGPIICGFLGEKINWHLGFGAAGIGMVLGLVQYRLGGKYLGAAGLRAAEPGDRAALRRMAAGIATIALVLALLAGLMISGILHLTLLQVAQSTGFFMAVLAVLYFASVLLFSKLSVPEKKRVVLIFVFFLAAVLFWSGYEQAGSSMNLFAERLTNRVIGHWEMPASWLQSVNPVFIIVFAPLVGALWVWLKSREPSTPTKLGYGLLLLASGFLVLAWGATFTRGGARVSPMWLVVTYFLHTVGELCLSPVGLSSVTKLAPRRLVGQMMGTWFLASSLGNLIAGLAAGQIKAEALEQMPWQYLQMIFLPVIAGIGLIVLAKPIRKWMAGVD